MSHNNPHNAPFLIELISLNHPCHWVIGGHEKNFSVSTVKCRLGNDFRVWFCANGKSAQKWSKNDNIQKWAKNPSKSGKCLKPKVIPSFVGEVGLIRGCSTKKISVIDSKMSSREQFLCLGPC